MSDKELAEESHKPIIRKFEIWKVHSSCIYRILGADLADMRFISRFNKEFRFYYVLSIFIVNMHKIFV